VTENHETPAPPPTKAEVLDDLANAVGDLYLARVDPIPNEVGRAIAALFRAHDREVDAYRAECATSTSSRKGTR